jgi:hypothetical protein
MLHSTLKVVEPRLPVDLLQKRSRVIACEPTPVQGHTRRAVISCIILAIKTPTLLGHLDPPALLPGAKRPGVQPAFMEIA